MGKHVLRQYRQNQFNQGLRVYFSQTSAPAPREAQRGANNDIQIEKHIVKKTDKQRFICTVSDDTNKFKFS